MTNINIRDFQPINTWQLDLDGPKWEDGEPMYLTDLSTGKKYWNESRNYVVFKCFLLTLGTPFVHSIVPAIDISYKVAKLISFSHFWRHKEDEKSHFSVKRLKDAGQDLLKIITAPFAFIGLESAAIYGIVTPYNGRKLYASIERAQYGRYILAPCFQPDPKYHALGGNPEEKNAF